MANIEKTITSYGRAAAVTPHDTNDLAVPCDALFVGGTGALKVDTAGGDTVTLSAVPAGAYIPLRCTRVYDTGTAATGIIAMYNPIV